MYVTWLEHIICNVYRKEKTSLRPKPGHLTYLDMHYHYEWIELFSFCVFSRRKKRYCTHLFRKIQNKMTGHFLYYICIFQHKKLHQNVLKIFVVEILKYWAFLWCKNYIDYFSKSSFFPSHFLETLMKIMN